MIMIVTVNRDIDSAQSSRLKVALEVEFLGILILSKPLCVFLAFRNVICSVPY